MNVAHANATVLERDIVGSSATDRPWQRQASGELGEDNWNDSDGTPVPAESTRSSAQSQAPAGTYAQIARMREKTSYVVTPLAEWQGYVTGVEGDHFYATLDGVYGAGVRGEVHDAVIPLAEISPEDRQLVREGAYFRLSIAYSVSRGGAGTSTRTSTIVFRRLPAYQDSDLENAREISRELTSGLRLE